MPEGFSIGPLFIRFYGIILMLGAVAGGWLATRESKRRGYDPEVVWDLLVYLIIGGVIGARLWHIFTPSVSALVPDPVTGKLVNPYFVGGTIHILDILSIWKGGLGIPGVIIGGMLALFLYCRDHKFSFPEWTDIAAPSIALGQAIGRWGNFFNQELYGAPTNLPWKIYIDPDHRLLGYQDVSYYHPLFFYESVLDLANMFFLLWLSRRYSDRMKTGDLFLVYLITYPTVRFFLEFLRLDVSHVAGVDINQVAAGVVAICSAVFLIWRHRQAAGEELESSGVTGLALASSGGSVEMSLPKPTSAKTGKADKSPSRRVATSPKTQTRRKKMSPSKPSTAKKRPDTGKSRS